MRHGPIAGQSCRWNKCYPPGPAWSLERSSPNIKGGDRTAIAANSAMAGCATSQRVNAVLQRPSAKMRICHSPVPRGTKWLAKCQNRPTHLHQGSLASHPQLGHHGQIGEVQLTVLCCPSVGFEKLAVGIVPIAANPCVSY